MALIDVIIPTYNSSHIIAHTLAALYAQPILPGWKPRIIISDDGSSDGTLSQITAISSPPAWEPTHIISHSHTGSAAARNRGIAESGADVILLLGADISLRPGAIMEHCTFHEQHPGKHKAALGFVKWDPRISPSQLMEWMIHGGMQNDFDSLLGKQLADPRHHFYGSHISLKGDILSHHHFYEQFSQYGWEDLELGRRLYSEGITLHVLHQAVGLHRHTYTASDIRRRQYIIGQGVRQYQQQAPKAQLLPKKPRSHYFLVMLAVYSGILSILWMCVGYLQKRYTTPRLFQKATGITFWWGYYS